MAKKFIVNPENGFWGFAQDGSERELLDVFSFDNVKRAIEHYNGKIKIV